ncbi:MAG: protein nirF [Deltaproteobacteria bacterium]|nr:protein nirF [Deltaproteobacteria bacterium]
MKKISFALMVLFLLLSAIDTEAAGRPYGTSALMVVVERESGSVVVIDSVEHEFLGRVEGLGDLRHATIVFSRDARFAFVIARDGTLSKIDLLTLSLERQAKAGETSIGIAISRDNRYVMVCNYSPGGAVVFDSRDLKKVKEIPAIYKEGAPPSRTVGPLDTPDNLMIFALMEGNSVWVVDMKAEGFPVIKKFDGAGETPYDQLITPDGRYYVVGFEKSDWMGLVDTWRLDTIRKIDVSERRATGDKAAPVHHIPHFESWAISGRYAFVPAFGKKRVLVYDTENWSLKKSIPISGTGLFVVARPGGREVWVDNTGAPGGPEERLIEIIDTETLEVKDRIDAGKGAIDPQFTAKGEAAYVSIREEDRVAVYDTDTKKVIRDFKVRRPSGIFSSYRAGQFGL